MRFEVVGGAGGYCRKNKRKWTSYRGQELFSLQGYRSRDLLPVQSLPHPPFIIQAQISKLRFPKRVGTKVMQKT